MQSLSELLGKSTQQDASISNLTEVERVQYFVNVDNARQGHLNQKDFDCKVCLNKGWIAVVQQHNDIVTQDVWKFEK